MQGATIGLPGSPSEHQVTGVLDKGVRFKGYLSFEGVLRVSGEVEGEIHSKGTLIIEPEAKVRAKVCVHTLVAAGYLEGEVTAAHKVLMHPPAVFKGRVSSPSLFVDEGVVFEGVSIKA